MPGSTINLWQAGLKETVATDTDGKLSRQASSGQFGKRGTLHSSKIQAALCRRLNINAFFFLGFGVNPKI